jgi:TolB protein
MKRTIFICSAGFAIAMALFSQITGKVIKTGEKPAIAIPDLRGSGDAQRFMDTFNATLLRDVGTSGQLTIRPKTTYPLRVPQQPSDFRPPAGGASQGPWLTDWSGPPVNANYLAFGYTAVQGGQMVLYGWLYDVSQSNTSAAQALGKVYTGSLDEAGARKISEQFACDIVNHFGGTCLLGSRIYFVSDRTGHKEIWSMNYDGSDQKQFTSYGSITTFPTVSPDATKIAFTTYPILASSRYGKNVFQSAVPARSENLGQPQIYVHSLETGRKLVYYNQRASFSAASDFMPDSRHLLIYSTAGGGHSQIFETDLDGSGLRQLTHTGSLEVEPKVNPKTGNALVFVSGRGGTPQIYRMNMDGTDVQRLTTGEGDAVNPAWNPDGEHIAFSWTRGFEPGNFNIFVMDVASRSLIQLTHGVGRNENPSWAPDGVHLVFSSTRGRTTQIYTMLADGTGLQQLTTRGNNEKPVWAKASQ